MIQQVLSHYHLPLLSCIGLGLFMTVFLGAVIWVCRGGSGRFYDSMGALPFEDEPIVLGGRKYE